MGRKIIDTDAADAVGTKTRTFLGWALVAALVVIFLAVYATKVRTHQPASPAGPGTAGTYTK